MCGCHGDVGNNHYCTLRALLLDSTLKAYYNRTFTPTKNIVAHREIIEDIVEGCTRDCGLKDIALRLGVRDRTFEQIKCIEKLEYGINTDNGISIGKESAARAWVMAGMPEIFTEVYRDGMKASEIYHEVMKKYLERNKLPQLAHA